MLRRLFGHTAARQRAIPTALWEKTLAALPVFRHLDQNARDRLKALSEAFLAEKKFYGARGLELTDAMLACIAAQATLPILELGLSAYRGWVGIVLYPDEFVIPKRDLDDAGVMHAYDEVAAGEAWEDGPVLLSWSDVKNAEAGYNVVLHEFAHKLDLLNGEADGVPRLHSGISEAEWRQVLETAFTDFCQRVEMVEKAVESHPTPDTVEQALCSLPLDDYAAEDLSEFFAVASESFFTDPQRLQAAYPALYQLLTRFYRQDPLRLANDSV